MTSTEIAEKLSCIPEKDIELLTGMMLEAKNGDDRRLLIELLDRVNEYAYLTENGIPLGGIAYRDFVMGNCPIDAPSPETVEQFRKTLDAAEAGDTEAQYTAAMMAMEGAVGLPDFDAAVKWLQKAAETGHPGALYELGICRLNGEGMQPDAIDAVHLLESAADLGSVDAMLTLASIWRGAKGVPADPKKVFAWYKRAADAGSAYGWMHVGICAFNGEGTPTDRTYALECVKTAERLGCSDAKMLYRRMERYLEENQDAE